MSYSVDAHVQVVDGPALPEFQSLAVDQFTPTHHVFALECSFESLARALKVKPDILHTLAHKELMGKDIAIDWQPKQAHDKRKRSQFTFKGTITEVVMHTNESNYYHISGYSPTYLLEDGKQNRTFVKASLKEIFEKVLGVYPVNSLQWELKPLHTAKLPYVVQYQETNYQFLARLAAQQGEWFYYDGQVLRLGAGPRPTPSRFQNDGIQSFALAVRLEPSRAQGAHYNYRTHEPLKAAAAAPAGSHAYSQFALTKSNEVFKQPHRLTGDTHLADRTQLKRALDQAAARTAVALVTLEGNSETSDLVPGGLLDVFDAAGASYGTYRALTVRHVVDMDGNYSNHFEAMTATLAAPPANLLAVPPGAQSELADVIDLNDPKHLGRIRVRYHWDVKEPVDAESGWLRVSTPYSGDGKGQLFTPEKGSQVLVGYEQGLAEFPVVLGNLFHASNPQSAKYTTPNNHMKGLQTAGGNKVVMMDKPGEQTIHLSNSNNKATAVKVSFKGDGSVHIHSNGPVTVNGSVIKLDAGEKGSIDLMAKTITIAAKEQIVICSETKDVVVSAETDITVDAKAKMLLSANENTLATTGKLDINGSTVDISGTTVKINE